MNDETKLIIKTAFITAFFTGLIMGGIQLGITGWSVNEDQDFQTAQLESQKPYVEFEQIRDKINAYETNIGNLELCPEVTNRTKVIAYRKLLNNAIMAWDSNNFGLSSSFLGNISLDVLCIAHAQEEMSGGGGGITGMVASESMEVKAGLWLVIGIIIVLILIRIADSVKKNETQTKT